MLRLNRLSIKSRLLIMLLLIGVGSILVVGFLSYRTAQRTIKERIFSQLTSLRASRAYEIESYLEGITKQARVFAQDATVARAMDSFALSFDSLKLRKLTTEQRSDLEAFYSDEFLPRLAAQVDAEPIIDTYLPSSNAARYIQYEFIVRNPQPVGEKDNFNNPPEQSSYSVAHDSYHDTFRDLTELFGYYDIFLIDPKGNVVYTVFKEIDIGTNLLEGPFQNSGLSRAFQEALELQDPGSVALEDFSLYRPSFNAPAAFVASPVYRQNQLVGVIGFQMPIDEINRIMTSGRNWQQSGMGETGETYLVGQDKLIRSVSRFLLEDTDAYLEALNSNGMSETMQERIRSFGTSVLMQEVDTDGVEAAIKGASGTSIIKDYRNVEVLSSFAPLSLVGLDWVILAEMDLAEAYRPLHDFERLLIVSSVGLILLITALAMLLANIFTRPINAFIASANKITTGERNRIEVDSQDEFGQLASSLNTMVSELQNQTDVEKQKNQQSEALLFNLLPARVAKRLTAGETQIVDRYPNVTVLYAQILGFGDLTDHLEVEESIELLNELVSLFDEAAESHGIEKVKTIGANYLAVCGVSVARLDHARRMLEFAQTLKKKLAFFNRQHETHLNLVVGIDSGLVVAGIVGLRKFIYDLWGEPVETAMHISSEAEPESIVVSTDVYDVLKDGFAFQASTKEGIWALSE